MIGINLDADAQFALLERDLAPYVDELHPCSERSANPMHRFTLRNGSFEAVDAEILYGMIRHMKPQTIFEMGAGHSTLVAALAVRRNAADAHHCRFVSVDPNPPSFLTPPPAEVTELRLQPATEVSLEELESLTSGDILFVDTTHVVAVGSEVNYLILEVLPRLKEGVIVHFHDIFLPWEYPEEWAKELGYYWTEQYLLRAFLSFNPAFRVLFSAHSLARALPDRLARSVPSFDEASRPASFWIERIA